MSMNKILLLGNLGTDPEVRFMPSGKQTTQFSLATNRKYKLEGELREETEWFHVVAFGRLAEIASEYLKKGRQVFIEGRLRTRNWTDNGGQKHYRTEVIAEGLKLIGAKANGTSPILAEVADNAEPF
jgi:single-strand DNA-binding protein